ncbi:MAG: hypothetical protein ABFS45_12925 [Pseudomonadota bacterium]
MIPLSYSKAILNALYDELHKANRNGNAHLARVITALILVGEKKTHQKKYLSWSMSLEEPYLTGSNSLCVRVLPGFHVAGL